MNTAKYQIGYIDVDPETANKKPFIKVAECYTYGDAKQLARYFNDNNEIPGRDFDFIVATPRFASQASAPTEAASGVDVDVRDVKKWPPEKDGCYMCIVEGIPAAMGKWLMRLEYKKSEGGFLQEDDHYRPIQWLTSYPSHASTPPTATPEAAFDVKAIAMERYPENLQPFGLPGDVDVNESHRDAFLAGAALTTISRPEAAKEQGEVIAEFLNWVGTEGWEWTEGNKVWARLHEGRAQALFSHELYNLYQTTSTLPAATALNDEGAKGYKHESWIIAPRRTKKVVCYCGSLRKAKEAFQKAEYESLMKGEIALLPCCMFVDIEREYGAGSDYKVKADENHKRKIDICDEVFVLNVGGYIGESTRSEIAYAESIGKPVKYLENTPG